jgi:hypothetical protein
MPNRISPKYTPSSKILYNNYFDSSKSKEERYYGDMIRSIEIWQSEKDFVDFMDWLKSSWKDCFTVFAKWDNERIKKYVANHFEWRKVQLQQNLKTICLPCLFRWDDHCGSFEHDQLPIPVGKSCSNLRTKLRPGEVLASESTWGHVYATDGTLLGICKCRS